MLSVSINFILFPGIPLCNAGALDWWRPFRDAMRPVFEKLYSSVETGEETRRTLEANSRPTYKADLKKELDELAGSEMWRAGRAVRALRPENVKADAK